MRMNRRKLISVAAATSAAAVAGKTLAAAPAAAMPAVVPRKSIVLYCDLAVDPKREKEMLDHFHKVFAPVATKHAGYIDLKLLRISKHIQGPELPKAINFRFQLTYETEAQRLVWVNSADHAKAWPGLEATLLDKNFQVYVFDNV